MAVENRTEFVGIKLKPSELEAIKVSADREGKTVSEFIRDSSLSESRREERRHERKNSL